LSGFALPSANTPSTSMHSTSQDPTLLYQDVVGDDGWIRTAAGRRVVWVPYSGGRVIVKSDSLIVYHPSTAIFE
jgi:hypothetical protein